MEINKALQMVKGGETDDLLKTLYGKGAVEKQRLRYADAVEAFRKLYPEETEISIFSAPGRTEVCGNHTDHQHGRVLAAAVNLDAIAVVAFHEQPVIRLKSEGYPAIRIETGDLSLQEKEKGTTAALIRGMAVGFRRLGVGQIGFDAYVTSSVLSGSGLSSSAAFEVLIGNILDLHYNEGKAGAVEIAKMGQFAENEYFGKKSGLMDQMVSSVGGFVFIDFADTDNPFIEKHECDFAAEGYELCITDTHGSHADLTDDYVAVPAEMKQVAVVFKKEYLREISAEVFHNSLGELHRVCTDRAILRAAHYYQDDARVPEEVKALDRKDIPAFLELVRESGNSSARWLQNLYSVKKPQEQGITLGLMASEHILGKKGACRVHGGGFAGTIQAFVPESLMDNYVHEMDQLFGLGSCYRLSIRPCGGVQII